MTMQGTIKNIARAVLLLYGIYAFSPVYMSLNISGSHGLDDNSSSTKRVSIGIVWVNFLVSAVVFHDNDAAEAADGLVSAGAQGDDMILIKKKRVVCRSKCRIKPILTTDFLPAGGTEHSDAPASEYEIVGDPLHKETGVYIYLSTGLSPPDLLS